MPVRETHRIDLEQAIDNLDGTVSARAYPLQIWPRRSNNYTQLVIDNLAITPNSAIVEIWLSSARGSITKYTTYNGGILPRAMANETEPIRMTLYNLSRDTPASIELTTVSYQYSEPAAL